MADAARRGRKCVMSGGWRILRLVVACLGVGLGAAGGMAQEAGPDKVAFDAALRAFDTAMFSRAVSELEAMVKQFPDSPLKPAALERAAFARGEAALAASNWKDAAAAFGVFLKDYPGSTNRLRGSWREAYALQKAGDLAAVRDRLQIPDGVFQSATRVAESPADLLLAGWLLLAEARLGLGDAAGALAALESGKPVAKTPEAQWQRERLRHDAAREAGKADERLVAAEALVALSSTGEPVKRAEAVSLAARAMEAVGQADRADVLWEKNSDASLPAEYQREAVLRIAERLGAKSDLPKARARLERFLTGRPAEPVWHAVRLALGQVLFRQYAEARGAAPMPAEIAGLPAQILGQLDVVLTNQPAAELVGPVQYLRGWCLGGGGGDGRDEPTEGLRDRLPGGGGEVARVRGAGDRTVQAGGRGLAAEGCGGRPDELSGGGGRLRGRFDGGSGTPAVRVAAGRGCGDRFDQCAGSVAGHGTVAGDESGRGGFGAGRPAGGAVLAEAGRRRPGP